jgi:magnesium transporter
VLLWEHDEDLARLAGVLRGTASARAASEEPILCRYWHRLPWLALGLLGALLATGIVGAFEAQLERRLVLAFFLPGIVYMADAVGTQTETLVVRGLSLGIPIGRVLLREVATGCLVGATVAVAFWPLALWLASDAAVAVAVSAALLAACSTASLVGLGLPWALARVGFDPAFGSGPVATVVQDLLSIVIYLAVAAGVVR